MSQLDKIDQLIVNLKEYVSIQYKLSKLEAIQRITVFSASVTNMAIIGVVGFLFVLFSSLSMAFFLSSILGNNYVGFAIIAAFYLLVIIVLFLSKKGIIIAIREKITSQLMNE
jgi:hypothetical protein